MGVEPTMPDSKSGALPLGYEKYNANWDITNLQKENVSMGIASKRWMGIEPTSAACKAAALPLSYRVSTMEFSVHRKEKVWQPYSGP
jgi:hypothetical protein